MSLSPVDISRHEFSKSLRGYDKSEVRAFLEAVASEMAQLQIRLSQAEESSRGAEQQLKSFRDIEKNLRDAVMTAQQGVQDARHSVERERETLLKEARLDAERLLLESERQLSEIHEQIRQLMLQKETFAKRLRYLHESHGQMLDMIENETPDDKDESHPKAT